MLSIILALVVVGFILWLVEAYIPMDAQMKSLMKILIIIILVLWIISRVLHMFPGAMNEVNGMW